jgi:hypothetical protein
METPYRKDCSRALGTYIRAYYLFRSGSLSTDIKLAFYKALIKSVVTYFCPIWKHVADVHLLKLQLLQNIILSAIGNLDRCTQVSELHVAFKSIYVCDYINNHAGHMQK